MAEDEEFQQIPVCCMLLISNTCLFAHDLQTLILTKFSLPSSSRPQPIFRLSVQDGIPLPGMIFALLDLFNAHRMTIEVSNVSISWIPASSPRAAIENNLADLHLKPFLFVYFIDANVRRTREEITKPTHVRVLPLCWMQRCLTCCRQMTTTQRNCVSL
jgi:hypothetical protein